MSKIVFDSCHIDTIQKLIPFMMEDIFDFWHEKPTIEVSIDDNHCVVSIQCQEVPEAALMIQCYIQGHLRKI